MNTKQNMLGIINNCLLELRDNYIIGQNDVKDITTMILNRINSCGRIKETAENAIKQVLEKESNTFKGFAYQELKK